MEIIPLSDLHFGDNNCDIKLIGDIIQYIAETDNAYCVLNGDLMNSAITNSVSDTYKENLTPMDELALCVKIFGKIKDKILFVTGGNHEYRHYKTNGIDITRLMCQQIGIEDKYAPEGAMLFLRIGENANPEYRHRPILYTMYMTHGSGGGKKIGGKLNRVEELSGIIDADIYLHGHTHLPAVFKQCFYRVDYANSNVSLVEKTFVNANAFLNYGGYGQIGCFKPSSKSVPHIMLDGKVKKVTVTL